MYAHLRGTTQRAKRNCSSAGCSAKTAYYCGPCNMSGDGNRILCYCNPSNKIGTTCFAGHIASCERRHREVVVVEEEEELDEDEQQVYMV